MTTAGDAMTHFLAQRAAAHPRPTTKRVRIRKVQPTHLSEYESSVFAPHHTSTRS